MTWTRLFYIKNMHKAMERVIPGKPRQQLAISKRYQAEVRKQFRLNGVPWIYNLKEPTQNPRDRKPQTKARQLKRAQRLITIQKALAQNDKKNRQFWQQKMDKRSHTGVDRLIMKTMPSFIHEDSKIQVPEYMLKTLEKKRNQRLKKK